MIYLFKMKAKQNYPLNYEDWKKLPSTIKAMKIIMTDYNNFSINQKQLKLDLPF